MSDTSESSGEAPPKSNPVDLSFLIHTIPDIPRDAAIIGLCTVASEGKVSDAQKWYLSAFAAWKSLLGKAHSKNPQTWFSGIDGWAYSPLHFGGKRVDEAFNDEVKVLPDPHALATAFLLEIVKKTAAAAGRKPIVVIVCGPTGLAQDIPFGTDPAQPQATVTVKHMQVSSKGVKQLMLITPSMLAATWWMVNPHINQTMLNDASTHIPPNTGKTPLTTTNLVKAYARRCTLMFMDQLLPDVLSERSLFLHPKYEAEDTNPVRCSTPTQLDTAALVSQAARQALYNNVAPLPVEDGFFFFPKADTWPAIVRPRKGLPLQLYERFWEDLTDAPPSARTAFPHGFGRSASSWSKTHDKAKLGIDPLHVNLEMGKKRADASPFHWGNEKHMNAAYQLAAMSLADAVVLFSKFEQPQGQPCIRWNPSADGTILLANADERKWFKAFIWHISQCRIFQNPRSGKPNFGLSDGIMVPDDAKALVELYSHPVMYMWQAFKLKHQDVIRDTANKPWSEEARHIMQGLPEVFSIIQLMWQGLWQGLLENPSMQRTSRMFFHSMGLHTCPLPHVVNLDQVEVVRMEDSSSFDFDDYLEEVPLIDFEDSTPTDGLGNWPVTSPSTQEFARCADTSHQFTDGTSSTKPLVLNPSNDACLVNWLST
ncbi:hypothetical protein F5X68DRAFT_238631 [Plectosphaerella plurivora]|uniref:Uncharacterized protein n=1 Tax=Plectosphaerella plurivora TaxID=936078 RepID=A0A9P9AGG6_9PEZI|nr:hypothetical protein F5X68DRAFT_238631 [Plectosphaerella plurivora]